MFRFCLIAFRLWFGCCALASGAAVSPQKSGAGDAVFTNSVVREIRIIVDAVGMADLRRDTREYVKATFQEVLPEG